MADPRPRARAQRGFALLAVLWICALLSVMAFGLTRHTRMTMASVDNAYHQLRLEAAAQGAIASAVFELSAELDATDEILFLDLPPVLIDDLRVDILVEDEAGKIDLNFSEIELIEALLANLTGDPARAADAAFELERLRDGDGDPLGITSIGTLLDIARLPPESLAPMRSFVTLNGLGMIDPLFARPEVLAAVPGMSDLDRAGPFETRDQVDDLFDELEEADDFLDTSDSTVFRVRASIVPALQDQGRQLPAYALDAIVELTLGEPRQMRYLEWSDGEAAPFEEWAPPPG